MPRACPPPAPPLILHVCLRTHAGNWFDDWMLGDEQDDETELGTIFGEAYLANPADKIPIGLSSDPLQ